MKNNGNEKNMLYNTIYVYIMKIVSYIFPLITTPYLTRILQENGYGVYSWTNAIINYVKLVVDFGFVIYGVEAIANYRDDKVQVGKIINIIIKCKSILCVISAFVLLLLCLFVEEFKEYYLMIFLSFIPVIISVFNIDYVFQGMEKMKYITMRVTLSKTIFTILIFICISKPEHYLWIPVFATIGDLIAVITMWITVKKMRVVIVRTRLKEGLEIIRKSIWYFVSRVSGAVYSYGNLIFLGILVSKEQVAQYSVAYTVVSVAQGLITPIADGLFPYMITNKNYKLVKKVICCVEPLIVLSCVISVFFAKPVIMFVFGKEYEIASIVFCCMLPSIIVTLPGCLLGFPTLSSMGLYKEANLAVLIAALWHLCGVCGLYITEHVSIYSIAILTASTESVVAVIRGVYVIRENRCKL